MIEAAPRDGHMKRGVQKLSDLAVGIKMGLGAARFIGQQCERRNLGARVDSASIVCELADLAKTASPAALYHVLRRSCPGECQFLSDVRGPATFHESREVRELSARLLQLIAEAATHREVIGDRLSECLHCTPGQG